MEEDIDESTEVGIVGAEVAQTLVTDTNRKVENK